MGIRLDGGTAYSGAVITRFYDSLLEKVTTWAPTPEAAIARMDRALREFRIRGVATNIAFVENLLKHPSFSTTTYHTRFIDETPELFEFTPRQDRATKLLTYIADITVNGHPDDEGRPRPHAQAQDRQAAMSRAETPAPGTRQLLEAQGPQAVADWMLAQERLLITDTTMRDGHQSLLATRMRSHRHDRTCRAHLRAQPAGACSPSNAGAGRPSTWPTGSCRNARGSACARSARAHAQRDDADAPARLERGRIHQLPRQRRAKLRGVRPPRAGVDVFRVFDSLNWVENMRVAMDAVIDSGKICEGTICYTGDMLDPNRSKYDLTYYVTWPRTSSRPARMCSASRTWRAC